MNAPWPGASNPASASPASGWCDRSAVGLAAWRLGAGRSAQGEPVQAGAGVEIHARPGDPVAAGDPVLTLHTDDEDRFARALDSLEGGWDLGESVPSPTALVIDRIG